MTVRQKAEKKKEMKKIEGRRRRHLQVDEDHKALWDLKMRELEHGTSASLRRGVDKE
jgi:hypothetical protein